MRRALLIPVLAVLSCGRPSPTGGLAVEADAEGVGGIVYVNGRVVGRMHEAWWFTTSRLDTVAIRGGHVTASSLPRPDSSLASRLDVVVPMGRGSELAIVSKSGVRIATRADLGESTQVHVSFAERRIWVEARLRVRATLSDSSDDDGYHDEVADSGGVTVAKTVAAKK